METLRSEPEKKERLERMTLYHGTKAKLNSLENRQAAAQGGLVVPEGELLNAIYFTPDKTTALAMGARPYGLTEMGETGDFRTIHFEHPELFDPETEVYIYSIDTMGISEENLQKIDENQYVVRGLPEIKPESCEVFKAKEIFKYFKQI